MSRAILISHRVHCRLIAALRVFRFDRRRGIAVSIVASGNYCAGAIWPLILAGTLETHGIQRLARVRAPGVSSSQHRTARSQHAAV